MAKLTAGSVNSRPFLSVARAHEPLVKARPSMSSQFIVSLLSKLREIKLPLGGKGSKGGAKTKGKTAEPETTV